MSETSVLRSGIDRKKSMRDRRSSMQSKRLFLSSLGCLDDVLLLEEESGHFLKAAVMARSWGDLLKEADLLEMAGDFQEAAMCLIWYVLFRAAWGNGNRGWSLKQFDQMEEICNKVKSLAKRYSKGFYEFVCSELKVIIDQRNILAELKKDFHNSKENGSFMGKLLCIRKILDAHFHCHFSKYNWEDKILFDFDEYSGKIFETQISIRTLYSYWYKWVENVCSIFENLERFHNGNPIKHKQHSVNADWIRNYGQKGLYTNEKCITIDDCKYLNVTSTNRRRLKRFLEIYLSYFDLMFPLDWQNIVSEDLVPLRKIHLEGRLLEEIILHWRNNISCFLLTNFMGDLLRKREDKKLNLDIEVVTEAFLRINDPLVIVHSANVTPKIATTCVLFVDLRKSKDEIVSILFPRKKKHIVRILSGAIPEVLSFDVSFCGVYF
ncbi:hypothetical protein Tco_0953180 [Tanacetum coccineum]|uniref:Uncharacterized protein n=1 Tax=Tanacetum coccineum TaxID=301880 RepID=A0ABQ5DZ49_9ASTR